MEHLFALIAFVTLVYCLFSAKLGQFAITMPMFFLVFGSALAFSGAVFEGEDATVFHSLAEITLALLLFADATGLHGDTVRKIQARTARMLLIGLPLAIVFGALINLAILPDLPLWSAFLLAALLAPTDAALGQSIQTNERIPQALRDAMNAESGLNDGLALPFVIFFAGLAASHSEGGESSRLMVLVASQVGIGAAVGFVLGALAGKTRNYIMANQLMDHGLTKVSALLVVAFVYFAAEHAGGNSFVAVFVAGVAYTNFSNSPVTHARNFLEGDGQLFAMISFLFIGMAFVPDAIKSLTAGGLLVIALSLLVVRPLAIYLSLLTTKTTKNERFFYGWFGPRGLATALFAVFVTQDFDNIPGIDTILAIAFTTVFVSAMVHGVTAKFATQLFKLDRMD